MVVHTTGARGVAVKILASAGAVLVWFPIAFMALTSVVGSLMEGRLLVDFLMPAEFFPVVLLGGIMLVVAALLVKRRRGIICWSLGVAVLSFVLISLAATMTGLASGETAAAGLPLVLVISLLAVYTIMVLVLCVGSAQLLRDLFGKVSPSERSGSAI